MLTSSRLDMMISTIEQRHDRCGWNLPAMLYSLTSATSHFPPDVKIIDVPPMLRWGNPVHTLDLTPPAVLFQRGVSTALRCLATEFDREAEGIPIEDRLRRTYQGIVIIFEAITTDGMRDRHTYGISGPLSTAWIRRQGHAPIRCRIPDPEIASNLTKIDIYMSHIINGKY